MKTTVVRENKMKMTERTVLLVGLGVSLPLASKLFIDAHTAATTVCGLYPSFSFYETFQEELWQHHTWLPGARVHIPTMMLLSSILTALLLIYFHVLQTIYLGLSEITIGRYLHELLVIQLPAFFTGNYGDVPELVSDGETDDDVSCASFNQTLPESGSNNNHEDKQDCAGSEKPVDKKECDEAIAKLVQVKQRFAHTEIRRPDDWLVFDPAHGLVLQKQQQSTPSSIYTNGSSPVDIHTRQRTRERPLPTALHT